MTSRAQWNADSDCERQVTSDRSEDSGPARRLAEVVPVLIDGLLTGGSDRIYRDAARIFERPLFSHVLRLTRGNQLQAARLLGLNRNTLRKRCRELDLPLPRGAQGVTVRSAGRRPPGV